jgi:prevent-host-death family protein
MIKVTATNFRKNLFEYLDKVSAGETVVIHRNNKEVARLVSLEPVDWRVRMTETITVNVTPEELIEPIEGVWDDYK